MLKSDFYKIKLVLAANDGCVVAKPKFECPDPSLHVYRPPCYCPDGSRMKFKRCDNDQLRALPCGKYELQDVSIKNQKSGARKGRYFPFPSFFL